MPNLSALQNHQVRLASRPIGEPTRDNWSFTTEPVAEPGDATAGKAPVGASYSSSVYIVGTINGAWGVYRSDNGGNTWTRFNDDKHQYTGIGPIAADQTVAGRLYIAGVGRGVLFSY